MNSPKKSESPISVQAPSTALDHGQSDEDLARADLYGLLSELFGSPPSDHFFNRLAASPLVAADEPQAPLVEAWQSLVLKASRLQPRVIRAEFDALFVAVGKPEVMANASYYLSGALNQQPLVDIREALDRLGIERDPEATETEDHFAAVCEVMRFLVAGEVDERAQPGNLLLLQRDFFSNHLAPWVFDFLEMTQTHRSADFYQDASIFARCFLEVERQAFDIYASNQAGSGH